MKIMKNKKKLALILAVVSVFTLALGSLAYFTDRININTSFKTVKADDIINVTPNDDKSESEDPGEDLEDKWFDSNKDILVSDALVRPGDGYDLSYNLTNLGDDIDVRETIMLTVLDYKDAPMSSMDTDAPEWRLFSTYDTDKYGAKEGDEVIATESRPANHQVKYSIAPFVLSADETKALSYQLILDKYAGNEFQGSVCKVEYLVEMRQHTDGLAADEGWEPLLTADITFGGQNDYKAVPAA